MAAESLVALIVVVVAFALLALYAGRHRAPPKPHRKDPSEKSEN
ncbi:hypothetical protein [Chromobacterium violaceum]|nr:hypothetical protein [Chromobacterium violaceum]